MLIAPTPIRSELAVTAGSVIESELATAPAEAAAAVLSTPDHALIAAVPAVLALMLNWYELPALSAAVARLRKVYRLTFGLPLPDRQQHLRPRATRIGDGGRARLDRDVCEQEVAFTDGARESSA